MRRKVQALAMLAAAPALALAFATRGVQAPTLLITASAAALLCGVWSQIERSRSAKLKAAIAAEQARSRIALRLREELIGAGREAVVAWASAGTEPLSFGGGAELLDLCLGSAEGGAVKAALSRLREHGMTFALTIDAEHERIALRGCVVGDHAAVFLRREQTRSEAARALPPHDKSDQFTDGYVEALNQLVSAVAIFSRDRRLLFHNRCYARLFGLKKAWLDSRPSESEILDRLREKRQLPEQADFAAWKRTRLELFETSAAALEELWHLPSGTTLRVVARRRPAGGFVYLYEDVSERLHQKTAHNAVLKVHQATLDTLQEGVAVFGTDGKLRLHNLAFALQWRLEAHELRNAPHLNAIADACARRFKGDRLWETISRAVTSATPDQNGAATVIERSDKRIISLVLTRLPDGATLATFADLTDQMRLQAALSEQPIASLLNEA